MTKDTSPPEKNALRASQTVKYFFICSCGCGQMSEELGKEYIRLRKGQKWYAKGCTQETAQNFKGGVIIKEDEF